MIRHTLLAALLAGCLPALALAQAPSVQVQHAWARATAGAGRSAVIYLTLLDQGAADRLTGVSTPAAGMAMLHESVEDHGIARMKMLDGVALPAGGVVTLRPGGMHIMLTALMAPLRPGASFPLTLSFAHAAPVTVTVAVLAAGASGPAADDSAMPGMKMP